MDHGILTAMHTEYLVVNDHGEGKEVEHVREVCPDMGTAVFPYTFGVEAVCLMHILNDGRLGDGRGYGDAPG